MPAKKAAPLYLDVELLSEIIKKVEAYSRNSPRGLPLEIRGRIVAILYERLMRDGGQVTQATIDRYLRLLDDPLLDPEPSG